MVFKVGQATQPAEKVAPFVLSSWDPDWSKLYPMIHCQIQNVDDKILDFLDAGAFQDRLSWLSSCCTLLDLTTKGNHACNIIHEQA